ncbi:hypothetical protein BZA05DRAFT_264934 [Tricharina praecox]|uniref:uncharacterized protein n=1 Tax=Tricharina praecox TaxID=43433 RepID=UPI0022200D9A|nr:uncharacterized protein BZA05DRAFT_264934 [Tricharina praecox]KAI5854408.1 hypothetical protein BZA05DRAFT_264934 [Tricharina praecox]
MTRNHKTREQTSPNQSKSCPKRAPTPQKHEKMRNEGNGKWKRKNATRLSSYLSFCLRSCHGSETKKQNSTHYVSDHFPPKPQAGRPAVSASSRKLSLAYHLPAFFPSLPFPFPSLARPPSPAGQTSGRAGSGQWIDGCVDGCVYGCVGRWKEGRTRIMSCMRAQAGRQAESRLSEVSDRWGVPRQQPTSISTCYVLYISYRTLSFLPSFLHRSIQSNHTVSLVSTYHHPWHGNWTCELNRTELIDMHVPNSHPHPVPSTISLHGVHT